MIDLQNCKLGNLIPPVVRKDNASWTATEVDTLGYDYLTLIVNLGATDIALAALKVQESATSGSGGTDVTGLIFGTSANTTGSTSTLPSATDDDKIYTMEIDLRGKRQRYITLVATAGNGTAGTYASGISILSRAGQDPAGVAASRGIAQTLRV